MYVSRQYCKHVRLPKRGELRDPNHPRDITGSYNGISVGLLLVQCI
jgi:hypothetical protein